MKTMNWKQAWAAKCLLQNRRNRLPRGIKPVKLGVEPPPEKELSKPYFVMQDEMPHMHSIR